MTAPTDALQRGHTDQTELAAVVSTSRTTTSQATRRLKRHTHQTYHILRSIDEDAKFVVHVADQLKLPIVANLRCGRWYSPPDLTHDTCYLKSTDGHYGKWDLPMRRLNLHLLKVLDEHQGVIIIDSTRRGKRFPDALTRTVPLWCAAMNALLDLPLGLCTLPSQVSASESAAMAAHLSSAILPRLRAAQIKLPARPAKSLRPLWISPSSTSLDRPDPAELDFIPVYCVCVSRVVEESDGYRGDNYVYIQGAADDEENWAQGLTPDLFWSHRAAFLASADSCDAQLASLSTLPTPRAVRDTGHASHLPGTPLWIGTRGAARRPWTDFTHVINCTNAEYAYDLAPRPEQYLYLNVHEGKKGQDQLLAAFPVVEAWFAKNVLGKQEEAKVLVHCNQGMDRSVTVALLLLVRYYRALVVPGDRVESRDVSKDDMRAALLFVTEHHPRARG
ncbi:hypothetical protein AMAG_06289 [Allomyces macrogynus ATCC 38327]|uniref:Uncharacterized protein n=1 Tax=Allomyces macrogynus (strain ATCC 38327) TaxID=578462 RepID=A0A0L0SGB3_ALLM3|nr:hypothetical protein AMAG_06289 [Allomyces macrogynus ATCC 38327]|eukprot:KNE61469.1 hypothetical protein AMAG_06289 [Allomyces macrogynus ATCC 38327]